MIDEAEKLERAKDVEAAAFLLKTHTEAGAPEPYDELEKAVFRLIQRAPTIVAARDSAESLAASEQARANDAARENQELRAEIARLTRLVECGAELANAVDEKIRGE